MSLADISIAMNQCNHDFIAFLKQVARLQKIIVVCVYCGQVREVWNDGMIIVTKNGTPVQYAPS